MSGYINRAACRGRRPSAYASYNGYERAIQISAMLKNREVARFIVAPNGYGKTSLALEYAETMFSWAHTFWFNAQSPCFIRDLDDGIIAQCCQNADSDVALVVFDDVPALDAHRAIAFSREIDALLSKGSEVIVTCTPLCDSAGGYQLDRVFISAANLLLSDAELNDKLTIDERLRLPAEKRPVWQRVPAFAWSSGDDVEERFAKGLLDEEMPADLRALLVSSFVLQHGSMSDLLVASGLDEKRFGELAHQYPQIEVSDDLDRFQAPNVAMESIASAVKASLPALATRSHSDSPELILELWTSLLMNGGQQQRACDLVRMVYPRAGRAVWLVENVFELVRKACFVPMFPLACESEPVRGELKLRLYAIEAFCRYILGDSEGALRRAKHCGFDEKAPENARICGLLIIARCGGSAIAERANQLIEQVVDRGRSLGSKASPWKVLACAQYLSKRGTNKLGAFWVKCRQDGVDDDVLSVCASWLFSSVGGEKGEILYPTKELEECERYVRARLSQQDPEAFDFFLLSAAASMEEAHARGLTLGGGPLETSALMKIREMEMSVLSQRGSFEADEQAALVRRVDWASSHPDMLMYRSTLETTNRSQRKVPTLSIKLFGSFDVSIGGAPIDKAKFRRKNTRILLALLAVNIGKEISRDAVVQSMWPDSPEENGRKNFYTIWSCLKRAISLPDGTCPYLSRHRYGCSLETRYVHCDVSDLEETCHELLFGVPNMERWSQLYSQIEQDFSNEFMPSEKRNPMVVHARSEYRSRLVDALVAATSSIADTETPQWGVWFARTALKHDETREDAYVALMRAQIGSNQRTAAMMTYLKCRRVLSERLGIDPSPETTKLYESLLEYED